MRNLIWRNRINPFADWEPSGQSRFTAAVIHSDSSKLSSVFPKGAGITNNGSWNIYCHRGSRCRKGHNKRLIAKQLQKSLTDSKYLQSQIQQFLSGLENQTNPLYISIINANDHEDGRLSHQLTAKMWSEIFQRLCLLKMTLSTFSE